MRSAMPRAKRRQAWRTLRTAGTNASTATVIPPLLSPRDGQPVADATNGLQIERIGRIRLDLAAQPVDLHVDGALAGGAVVRNQRQARHRLARCRGEDRHD